MKKTVCLFLTLAMLFTAAAAAAAPQPAVTAVSYDQLADYLAEGNPALRALAQSAQTLRLSLASLRRSHETLMSGGAPLEYITDHGTAMQSAIRDLQKALEDTERALDDASGGQLLAARQMYLSHFLLREAQDAARRAEAAARSELDACRNKLALGLLPRNAQDAYEKAVSAARDAVRDAENAVADQLAALAVLLGIPGEISLAGLPPLDIARIADREFDADRAAYALHAPEVRASRDALEDAREALEQYADSDSEANRFALAAAKENYERARETAFRDFPRVYRELENAYADFVADDDVKDAEENLARLRRQFTAGVVSASAVTAAARALEDALGSRAAEELSLYLALLEYESCLTEPGM